MLYDKQYKSDESEARRAKNFIKNLKMIDEHNENHRNGRSHFRTGIWNLTDMANDEFLANFTGYLSRPKFRSFSVDYQPANLPDYLNYVEEGLVTRVAYQGYCGGM